VQRCRESIIEATQSISAIAMQIDLALREAEAPMERLAETVARIGATLAALSPGRGESTLGDLDLSVELRVGRDASALQDDYYRAVEDLQCHDRMVQHLGHLRDYLSGVSGLLAREVGDGDEIPATAALGHGFEPWEALREQLFQRLISDAQRQFLQMVLPARTRERRITSTTLAASHAAPGSIDLF